MKENSRSTQLLTSLRDREVLQGSRPVEKADVDFIHLGLQDLYEASFGRAKIVDLDLYDASDEDDVVAFAKKTGKAVPQATFGRYSKQPYSTVGFVNGIPRRHIVIPERGEILFVINQNDPIVSSDPLGVVTAILSHEIIHSKAIPKNFTDGSQSNPLRSEQIGLPPQCALHWTTGFKVITESQITDPLNSQRQEYTYLFDEVFTQYLSMALTNSFGNETLHQIAEANKGISPVYIYAAEILNDIFRKARISSAEVAKFHRMSDIRGLLRYLNEKAPKLGRSIFDALSTFRPPKQVKGGSSLWKNDTDYEACLPRLDAVRERMNKGKR